LQILDDAGTVEEGLFQTLTKSFKYGLKKSDFKRLSQAIAAKKETAVLNAVSSILNKDLDNVLAVNSLAFYYLQNNRRGLGTLILNRVSSKKRNDPILMNNLAVVSLKYGDAREAVTYLKKSLSSDESYPIARVNLANIFIQQRDYANAYFYYKDSYREMAKKWPPKDRKVAALLNNYGVALTGVKRWSAGQFLFKNLTANSSPLTEVLFNYAIFLTEKSEAEESEKTARGMLLRAKELVDELILYSGAAHLRKKIKELSYSIKARLRELKLASSKRSRMKAEK